MTMFDEPPQTFFYDFTPPWRVDLTELRHNLTAMAEAV